MTALLPLLSAHDPKLASEGSLDPLGLAIVSERLADEIWPDVAIRMRRSRFLTGIAVLAVVTEPYREQIAADGVSPAHEVFEWYVVEAQAHLHARIPRDTTGVPGIDKARQAVAAGLPLSADRYLKSPSVFGFYGIYKRLARGLGIVNEDLDIGPAGMQLVDAWSKDRNLPGFGDPRATEGAGASVRAMWQEAVKDGLEKKATSRSAVWRGWEELIRHLSVGNVGSREAEVLRALLLHVDKGTQGEYFRLLDRKEFGTLWDSLGVPAEREFYGRIQKEVSAELGERLQAIVKYEGVARILDDAWSLVLHLGVRHPSSPVTPRDFAEALPDSRGPVPLADAIDQAGGALGGGPAASPFESLTSRFLGVQSKEELFEALIQHHRKVQEAKPPDGKRPWVESAGAGILVRPAYRKPKAPEFKSGFVNPYRTVAVASLLRDLPPKRS
jgi:hypothetical protein